MVVNEQLDLFSYIKPTYKITKPIRLIETFAGIGSQYKSLKNIGANVESWKCIEIDKFAIKSFNAVHDTQYETKDITKVHANELEITEREILLYSYLLISVC